MHILLVVPGSLRVPGVHLEDKFAFPVESLGYGYLAAVLRERGFAAEIVDGYAARWTWQETTARVLECATPESLIGFTVMQPTALATRRIAQALREAGQRGPIVLGGWLGSAAPLELMTYIPEADYLLQGEADYTFAALVECLSHCQSVEAIPGLIVRDSNGQLKTSVALPEVADVNALPLPTHYLPITPTSPPVPVQSSRGCYWGACSFCSTAGHYHVKHWRPRSVDSLLAEMRYVSEALGATRLCFVDDSFFGPCPEGFARAEDFICALEADPVPVTFAIDCLVGDVRPDLFARLKAVGLEQVFLGIEAGNDNSLKRFRKGATVAHNRQAIECLEALGIRLVSGYIPFEPYMSPEDVRANVSFLLDEMRHQGNPAKHLRKLIPIHGTPIWSRLKADGLLTGAFPDWNFRFRDERVAELHRVLVAESQPICDAYFERQLYQAQTEAEHHASRMLNQEFRSVFDDVYQRVMA